MTPPTDRVPAAKPIVEAPPDVVALIIRWIDEGPSWHLRHELTRALQPYRGVRLLTASRVVWLAKTSDRTDDEVCVMLRSWPWPLGRRGERTP